MQSNIEQQENNRNYDEWLAKKIEKSRAAANADNLIPAAEVEEYFARLRLEAYKNKVVSESKIHNIDYVSR